jgi:uncharacterized protein YjbI with pentapeptide repeats
MQNKQLWYTRRGSEVRGPFPAPQISRFILLGRIYDTDELSTDQHHWQKVSDVPVLVPEELKADLSDPEARERLMIARMREDERSARDRRGKGEEGAPPEERRQRSEDDRRRHEEEKMLRHREIKTAIAEAAVQRRNHYFLRGVLATLTIAALIVGAWYYQPWQSQDAVDCNAMPQPWVNWSNCLMEGVRLATADLRGARMRNANLAGGDLRGSQLGGADMAYTNLVGTKLTGAHMGQVALVGANLRNAELKDADLKEANMAYAILQNADLSGADLSNADLSNADLQGANLKSARLAGAKLDNAIWIDGQVCATGSLGSCTK